MLLAACGDEPMACATCAPHQTVLGEPVLRTASAADEGNGPAVLLGENITPRMEPQGHGKKGYTMHDDAGRSRRTKAKQTSTELLARDLCIATAAFTKEAEEHPDSVKLSALHRGTRWAKRT